MQAACESGDVFSWLEGGCGDARAACDAFSALYSTVREPWLVRALLLYHARTASARALELLARAPDHHARLALDALHDQLRGERAARHHALQALAPLVARRPPWLHLVVSHPLARDLLRAARRERDPAPLLNALLALAALLPAAPALAATHAHDLAEVLTRHHHLEAAASPASRAHLALGARALFRAAYATHPCTVVEALRALGSELGGGAAREAWERGVASLARGVALHPALVTGSRLREAEGARWSRSEPHDVLAECRRLSLPRADEAPNGTETPATAPPSPAPALVCRNSPAPLPGSGAQAALVAGSLRPGGEGWFPLGERSGAEAAPHTPLPPERDPEPEPAVEATPENTPARDEARHAFRFPGPDSPAARAIGRTPPAGAPHADPCAARLARVAAERRAADSPVPIGTAPPEAAARPEPRRPLSDEDREVRDLTLTARAPSPAPWADADPAPVERDARRLARPLPRAPARGGAAPPRRAASCGPVGAPCISVACQTVDAWPEPYEFLVADFSGALPDDEDKRTEAGDPTERLDRYLAELYNGARAKPSGVPAPPTGATPSAGELAEQLALAHAQLMYERWRRDAHAERNRRLLGRCRQVRALELSNAALRDRVRALTQERDTRRDRASVPPPPPPHAADERSAVLEAALAEERAGRLRAEAELREAEAWRARDAAELQRTRGESFEAARHVEALARAALAAERRAEHVRRLRRELLLLAEREARLGECVRSALAAQPAAGAGEGEVRALRAACSRAEAEAEASNARAEAAAARAHELEAAVGAREAALTELKRAGRAAAEEGAARVRALHDKYSALLRVVRASGARELELRAAAPTPRRAPRPPPTPPDTDALDGNCG